MISITLDNGNDLPPEPPPPPLGVLVTGAMTFPVPVVMDSNSAELFSNV